MYILTSFCGEGVGKRWLKDACRLLAEGVLWWRQGAGFGGPRAAINTGVHSFGKALMVVWGVWGAHPWCWGCTAVSGWAMLKVPLKALEGFLPKPGRGMTAQ